MEIITRSNPKLAEARANAKTLEDLRRVASLFNLSKGWAYHVWKARQS